MSRHHNLVNAACVLLLGLLLVGARACTEQLTSLHSRALRRGDEAASAPSTTIQTSSTMTIRT
jgi:hypothetical protein